MFGTILLVIAFLAFVALIVSYAHKTPSTLALRTPAIVALCVCGLALVARALGLIHF